MGRNGHGEAGRQQERRPQHVAAERDARQMHGGVVPGHDRVHQAHAHDEELRGGDWRAETHQGAYSTRPRRRRRGVDGIGLRLGHKHAGHPLLWPLRWLSSGRFRASACSSLCLQGTLATERANRRAEAFAPHGFAQRSRQSCWSLAEGRRTAAAVRQPNVQPGFFSNFGISGEVSAQGLAARGPDVHGPVSANSDRPASPPSAPSWRHWPTVRRVSATRTLDRTCASLGCRCPVSTVWPLSSPLSVNAELATPTMVE